MVLRLILSAIVMHIKDVRAPIANELKRKADIDTCMNGRPTKRQKSVDDSLIEGFGRLLSPRYLDSFPQEILLNIFQNFAEPWVLADDLADWEVYTLDRESRIKQDTLVALTKTCRRLNAPATSILYRCVHLRTHCSVLNFINSLRIQPRLAGLVKQVSCPQEVLMSVPYAFSQTFGDGGSSSPVLVRRFPCRIGIPQRVGDPSQMSYTYFRFIAHRKLLDRILDCVPGIRALSVSCHNPWHMSYPISSTPLEHLSKLSVAMPVKPETYFSNPSGDHPILTWLSKSSLGRYRALKQLELVYPRGKWTAHLATVETATNSGTRIIEKYVESLTTLTRNGGGSAEWDLLSLERDIFSPKHLRTLDYAGQSQRCSGACIKVQPSGWDLNRFLATRGRGITTLNLDWKNDHVQTGQLGPTGTLTSLPFLTNLTHLTVSMQVLFQQHRTFYGQAMAILKDPDVEFMRLFPPSLRVLRISEYMPGLLPTRHAPDTEDRQIATYNRLLYRFMEILRAYWLDIRDDRELWFRYCLKLERHPRMANEWWRFMLRWTISPQRHQDVGMEFTRVYPLLPFFAAALRREKSKSTSQSQ